MKNFILISISIITLVSIYFAFVISYMFTSDYYFMKAFENILWLIPIILPSLIVIFIVDSLYCDKDNKNWFFKETFIVILVVILFAVYKHNIFVFYIFSSSFLLAQGIKYLIFSRYCKLQKKN